MKCRDRFASSRLAPCNKEIEFGIRNPGTFLLVERWILGFGIRNTAQGIWNPANNWNPESKFHWRRIQNPDPGLNLDCIGFHYMGWSRDCRHGDRLIQVKTGLRESVYIIFFSVAALKIRTCDLPAPSTELRMTLAKRGHLQSGFIPYTYPTLISHIVRPKEADSVNSMSLQSRQFSDQFYFVYIVQKSVTIF